MFLTGRGEGGGGGGGGGGGDDNCLWRKYCISLYAQCKFRSKYGVNCERIRLILDCLLPLPAEPLPLPLQP